MSFTRKEVSQHKVKNDCWIVIKNKVYDVTNWIPKHPGGPTMISNLGGQDCTEEFKVFHLKPNFNRLKPFYKGEIVEAERKEQTTLSKDIELLQRDLEKLGAFKPDYWFYVNRGSIVAALFAVCLYFIQFSPTSLASCLISAVALGIMWQQLAFIGHDLGHHVVTHNKALDDNLSLFVGNAIQGISLEWWKHNHNTHHSLTNSVNYDPDIQHLPFMAVSKVYFKSLFSHYYNRIMKFDGAAEYFISIQHYMFYPIMSLARFNLYAQSFIHNIIGPGSQSPKRNAELLTLTIFWCWLSYLLSFTGSFSNGLLFMLVSHAVAGLVHVQICINHFSMEVFDGVPQRAFEDDGYVRSQLESTTDIDCHPLMDWFHGGLQFQIEHHIYPHLTRSSLRYVQVEIKKICAKHGLTYYSKPFFRANFDVLKKLYDTSKELKLSEMIIDGMNMHG